MKRLGAIVLLGTLVACNGGNVAGPDPPQPPPPPPVPVTYNGTYTGTSMTFTGPGGTAIVTGSTTISQTGSNLSFSDMEISGLGAFGMGRAVLTENNFDGTNRYPSEGCGTVSNHYTGWFSGSGDLMNMTCMLTSDSCGEMGVRGEMRRGAAASKVPKTSAPGFDPVMERDTWPWSPASQE